MFMKQNIYPNAAFREGDIAEKMEKKKETADGYTAGSGLQQKNMKGRGEADSETRNRARTKKT